jgi:hypothetical protein
MHPLYAIEREGGGKVNGFSKQSAISTQRSVPSATSEVGKWRGAALFIVSGRFDVCDLIRGFCQSE